MAGVDPSHTAKMNPLIWIQRSRSQEGQVWRYMPILSATWEAEVGVRSERPALEENVNPYLKNN
jgi:hypothetical protein